MLTTVPYVCMSITAELCWHYPAAACSGNQIPVPLRNPAEGREIGVYNDSSHGNISICSCAQVFEAADETLKEEDAMKERLCNELNMLVQQSAHAQLEKLEQVQQCCTHLAGDWLASTP